MKPTDELKHEHEIILVALGAVEREMGHVQAGGPVPAETVAQMLDFFQNFADRCHHAKEENLLFPRLEQRGLPADTGPIPTMLSEHAQGRRLVRAAAGALPLARDGDPAAASALADALLAYVRLLRAHINKEDTVLFRMADAILTPEDQAELEAGFARIEAEEMGEGTHERYHQLAHMWAG